MSKREWVGLVGNRFARAVVGNSGMISASQMVGDEWVEVAADGVFAKTILGVALWSMIDSAEGDDLTTDPVKPSQLYVACLVCGRSGARYARQIVHQLTCPYRRSDG